MGAPASPRAARPWALEPRGQQKAKSPKNGVFARLSFRSGPPFVLEFSYYRSWVANPRAKKKHCIALLPNSQRHFSRRCHSFSGGGSLNFSPEKFLKGT